MKKEEFQSLFTELTDIRENPFHPLVWIGGEPEIWKKCLHRGYVRSQCERRKGSDWR